MKVALLVVLCFSMVILSVSGAVHRGYSGAGAAGKDAAGATHVVKSGNTVYTGGAASAKEGAVGSQSYADK